MVEKHVSETHYLWRKFSVIRNFLQKKRRTIIHKRRGFTLIELLVVIAIIALLMAILMPALQGVKKQSKVVVCQLNLKQWASIFSMYTGDNNGFFNQGSGWAGRRGYDWVITMRPYYTDTKILICPAASKPAFPEGRLLPMGGKSRAWGVFIDLFTGVHRDEVGSYGMNAAVYNPPPEVKKVWRVHNTNNNWRNINAKGGNNIPLLGDCMWLASYPRSEDKPPQWDDEPVYGDEGMKVFCINRHNEMIDCLFMDSSVRKVGLKELWKLKWHRSFDTNGPWTEDYDPPPVWPEWMRKFRDY